jgi:hypothetical protein
MGYASGGNLAIVSPMRSVTYPWNSFPYQSRLFRNFRVREVQGAIPVSFSTNAATIAPPVQAQVNSYKAMVNVVPGQTLRRAKFDLGGVVHTTASNGDLVRDVAPGTGVGLTVGSVQSLTGEIVLSAWPASSPSTVSNFTGVQTPPTEGADAPFVAVQVLFRTAAAPLRPGSFNLLATMEDGTNVNVTAANSGLIDATRVKGYVDYETGVVELYFTDPTIIDPLAPTVDVSPFQIPGVGVIPLDYVSTPSIRYNAVSYTYLPLDASILGLDPVRLPSDGRVPIFKSGRVVVVHNTQSLAPQTVANNQTVNVGRDRLARLRVIGNDGVEITTGFVKSLDAGTVTFTNVAGMSQPVTIEHRIEDEALCAEAQITGDLRLTRPVTHDYPAGTSYVSSALVVGTLQAASQDGFSQETWTNVWADSAIGNPLLAQYDDTTNPIVVTNAGAITERWAVMFTSNTSFNVVGEQVGQIITGDTSTPLAPVNPATGVPYFTLQPAGWGSGWAAGNVYRFNTSGSNFPLWVARTVLQSPTAPPGTDQMTISIRGDIDQ